MAIVRQPIGSVYGVAMGLDKLPIDKDVRDALFRALENELSNRQFVLDAEERRVRCTRSEPVTSAPVGQEERFTVDPENGESGQGLRRAPSVRDRALSGALELSSDDGAGRWMLRDRAIELSPSDDSGRWALRDRTSGRRLLFDREGDSLRISLPGGDESQIPPRFASLEAEGTTSCCGLKVPPVVFPEEGQTFEGTIAADLVVRGTKVGSIELSMKSEIRYKLLPIGEIAGDCPGDCSDEIRRIGVAVTLAGSFSGELVILGEDGVNTVFGPTTTRVDFSSLKNPEPSSFDINRRDPFSRPGDPPLTTPLSVNGKILEPGNSDVNRFSIKFSGAFEGFSDSYGYRWTCTDGSMLDLVDPPYRFGTPEEAIGDDEPGGQTADKPNCQHTVTFVGGEATGLPLPTQQFVLAFTVNGRESTILGRFDRQGRFETTETDLTLLDLTEPDGCLMDVTTSIALVATHQTPRQQVGGDRLLTRSQCTIDPRIRNVDLVARIGSGQITLALLVAARCSPLR